MKIYLDDADYRTFLALMRDVARQHAWTLFAYCLMPNHFHLVVTASRWGIVSSFGRGSGRRSVEAADGFAGCFAFSLAPLDVGDRVRVVLAPAEDDRLQGAVQSPVASSVHSVRLRLPEGPGSARRRRGARTRLRFGPARVRPATSRCAALLAPPPARSSSQGQIARRRWSISRSSVLASWSARCARRAQLRNASCRLQFGTRAPVGPEPPTSLDQLPFGQPRKRAAPWRGCGEHERAQLVEAVASFVDGRLTRDQQHAQRLTCPRGARLTSSPIGEQRPRGTKRVRPSSFKRPRARVI